MMKLRVLFLWFVLAFAGRTHGATHVLTYVNGTTNTTGLNVYAMIGGCGGSGVFLGGSTLAAGASGTINVDSSYVGPSYTVTKIVKSGGCEQCFSVEPYNAGSITLNSPACGGGPQNTNWTACLTISNSAANGMANNYVVFRNTNSASWGQPMAGDVVSSRWLGPFQWFRVCETNSRPFQLSYIGSDETSGYSTSTSVPNDPVLPASPSGFVSTNSVTDDPINLQHPQVPPLTNIPTNAPASNVQSDRQNTIVLKDSLDQGFGHLHQVLNDFRITLNSNTVVNNLITSNSSVTLNNQLTTINNTLNQILTNGGAMGPGGGGVSSNQFGNSFEVGAGGGLTNGVGSSFTADYSAESSFFVSKLQMPTVGTTVPILKVPLASFSDAMSSDGVSVSMSDYEINLSDSKFGGTAGIVRNICLVMVTVGFLFATFKIVSRAAGV